MCVVYLYSPTFQGKYIGSGHGGRLKPSTAVYVAIHVTTTISEGIFCSWWPAIAGGQYYIDTHSKCMQDNLSQDCREEVIKHFNMHTSLLFSHTPHISHAHTHTDTCSVTPGCPCCWSGKKNRPALPENAVHACIYGCSVPCT